jgi:hypothetical protein
VLVFEELDTELTVTVTVPISLKGISVIVTDVVGVVEVNDLEKTGAPPASRT